jgi:hypothetical protein
VQGDVVGEELSCEERSLYRVIGRQLRYIYTTLSVCIV